MSSNSCNVCVFCPGLEKANLDFLGQFLYPNDFLLHSQLHRVNLSDASM